MRNLKTIQVVKIDTLINPKLDSFLDDYLETTKSVNKRNLKGLVKMILGMLYFVSLCYFLVVLFT